MTIDLQDPTPAASARVPAGLVIDRVVAHPLRTRLAVTQRTSQGDHPAIELLVVEVFTRDGLVGIGEGLARRGSRAYAALVDDVLAPRLLGRSAWDRRGAWRAMRAALTGRPGGQLYEAMAAIDIALWDLAGKAAGVPVHALLGGMGRPRVRAYASSINWFDDAAATAEIESALDAGFTTIKLKIAPSPEEAIARARLARRVAGDDVRLAADANWAFDVHEAIVVGSALADLGFAFFEEPIQPHDREGYRKLSRHLPIRLAAGESDFCATQTLEYLEDRSVALVQPDVARSGGISETWRIAELAAVFGAGYAPHVGWSGAICECASLHLAAAAEAFVLFEKMVFDNPLRQRLCHGPAVVLAGGEVAVPQGPGLGIELDRDVLAAMLVR